MKPNVLVIDNNDSFTGNLMQMLRESGLCRCTVMNSAAAELDAISVYDAFVFSPGPGLPQEFPAMSALLDRYHTTKSFLGVCLGHQAIAQYFGAQLVNLPKVRHGQRADLTIHRPQSRLFSGIANGCPVGLYHSWCVASEGFPECLEVTAVDENGIIMSLSHREYNIHGVQFHPESYITNEGAAIIKNFLTGL